MKWQRNTQGTSILRGLQLHASHTVVEGGRTKKKLTGAGIGAKFRRIMSRVTTKNLKMGLWGLFEKKRFLYFHLLAQMQIFGSKCSFLALNPFFSEIIHFFWHHHDWTPKRQLFCIDPDARRASGRPRGTIFRPKIGIVLRYDYITPIFSGQTDPTQWDHMSPMSWGNSG